MENDQVANDLTTKSLFTKNPNANSRIITRQKIIVAGLEEIGYLIKTFTKLEAKFLCKDGDSLEKGQEMLQITGDVKQLLSFERVIINILQRMSGIATETKNIIDAVHADKPFIAATRKTHWGLLDKKAVAMGGGLTHRLNLSDGILVKDNHLMFMTAPETLQQLVQTVHKTLIEIEVEDEENLKQLVELFKQTKTDNVLGILLDNFSPQETQNALSAITPQENIIYEASGGITKENIAAWAQAGVDIISLGALTHSAKAADLSLEIKA